MWASAHIFQPFLDDLLTYVITEASWIRVDADINREEQVHASLQKDVDPLSPIILLKDYGSAWVFIFVGNTRYSFQLG